MSLHLDPNAQRWLLLCDRLGCAFRILASEGTHAEQRAELDRLAADLGVHRTTDAGDFCRSCAVQLAPPIPREEMCSKSAWCLIGRHEGPCVAVPKREIPPTDFGPGAGKRRRY